MPGTIQSVERATAILRVLATGHRPLRLADISAALGLAKGTTHGILRTLQQVGLVDQDNDSGKYRLGPGLLHLGGRYLDGNELRARALNWSDSLAVRSQESVRIGTRHHHSVLVVHHHFRPDHGWQAYDVGALLPLHACALGKILLAFDPQAAVDLGEVELKPFTHQTVTSHDALLAQLADIRARGWAADFEELAEGEAGIAAPIRDQHHGVAGVIGISGATERLCQHGRPRMDLVSYVRDAARAISRELGARPC
jgi:DNA-binding IclR family transcriptional regulator